MIGQQRDDAVLLECMKGNVPDWMRTFKPITITDNINSLTYYVSPDVMSIGNNDNWLRVSFCGISARRLADACGCFLPTKLMSDQIHQNADLKLLPVGMGGSPQMNSTQVLIDHNSEIERQRAGINFNIISGIKKDIIVHHELLTYIHNICIYGWFNPITNIPIQGAQYEAHSNLYEDYSQCIRLINQKAILNGSEINLYDILNNPQYSHLISDDGFYDARQIYK